MSEEAAVEATSASKKDCFVICPIGADGSEIRRRSDQLLDYVIRPVVEKLGYKAIRADEIAKPGSITPQIIEHLYEDKLVIADITFKNPNVFYELALRHAFNKPSILIKDPLEDIPFDVYDLRAIPVDYRFIKSMDKCSTDLTESVLAIEKDPKVVTPVSFTLGLKTFSESGDVKARELILDLSSQVQQLKAEVASIQRESSRPTFGSSIISGPLSSGIIYDPSQWRGVGVISPSYQEQVLFIDPKTGIMTYGPKPKDEQDKEDKSRGTGTTSS